MNCESLLQPFSVQPISTQVLLGLLKRYKRPYDKIGEMVEQGYLIQVRKGLYVTSSLISPNMPEPFLIANHLYGPSYISNDSALNYWGLIPEKVFEITSVTVRQSKKFITLHTAYSFTYIPKNYYALGVESVALTECQTVMIAGREKCLCDKIITTSGINLRSRRQAISYIIEELRIEEDNLKKLNPDIILSWLPICPKRKSITSLIEALTSL